MSLNKFVTDQADINFSILSEYELENFIQSITGKSPKYNDMTHLKKKSQKHFSNLFKFVKIGDQLQVKYFNKYLTPVICDLILAKLYAQSLNQSNPIPLEILLSLSEDNTLQLAKQLNVSDDLKTPFLPENIKNSNELENLKDRIIRIFKALDLISKDYPKARLWEYNFPASYSPDQENKVLSDLKSSTLNWNREQELTHHTSNYILMDVKNTCQKIHPEWFKENSKIKPVHGDLFLNIQNGQVYILNQDNIETITGETFVQRFKSPEFYPNHWLDFNIKTLTIDWTNHQKSLILNLRGPIQSIPLRFEYRTFFQFGQRIFNFALNAKTEEEAKLIISQPFHQIQLREDGYIQLLS